MIASFLGACTQWISALIIGVSTGVLYTYIGIFTALVIFPIAYSVMTQKHLHKLKLATYIPEPPLDKT